jgi:hypothetical protein
MSSFQTDNAYPVIAERDYPAFVSLGVTGLPATYGEWMAQQRHDTLELQKVGETLIPVAVTPAGFKAYCDARAERYTRQHLMDYAVEHAPK